MRSPYASLFLCLSIIAGISLAHAAPQQDKVTITTYYPAPYGVYKTLQLYPSNQPAPGSAAQKRGVMYYNGTYNVLKYYNNTAWVNVTGADCHLKHFTDSGGDDRCDPGYFVIEAVARGANGEMLCCKISAKK
ncbi:MAG: hypothetical protein PHT59_01780 [Candidatus Omnitrophica bacterium]|nr:hypothetical protein [Candidatus Omnitrophota bacterium]